MGCIGALGGNQELSILAYRPCFNITYSSLNAFEKKC